jgi:hypothetical protein
MDNLEKLRASPTSFMRAGQQPPSVLSRAATRPLCLFVMGIKAVSGSHAAQTYPRDGFRGMILTPTASRLASFTPKNRTIRCLAASTVTLGLTAATQENM